MRSVRQILRSVASASNAAPPNYVAEYSFANGQVLPAINISKYPGLLFLHEIRSSNGAARLIVCWSTKDHFARDSASFAHELGGVLADDHGFVANPTFPDEPLWKRIRLRSALIAIAAVIGAIQVIVQTYNWLIVRPNLEVKAAETKFSAVEGQPIRRVLEISNHLPAAHRNIQLAGTLKDAAGMEQTVALQPARVPHIAAGGSQAVEMMVTAPHAGRYQLAVHVRASAGYFARSKTFDLVRDLTVWPERPVGHLALGYVRGDVAFVSGSLDLGLPAKFGLECELEIPRVQALRFADIFDFPYLDGTPEWQTVETPGQEDAVLSWNTGSIDGERSVEFSLALQRSRATDWSAVLRQAELSCQDRRSKDHVP